VEESAPFLSPMDRGGGRETDPSAGIFGCDLEDR
jgi:hypothetical protein